MKGVLLFAFNTDEVDYVKMAYATSQRVNNFLNLPCTLVTNKPTDYKFDKVTYLDSDSTNIKNHKVWLNKGRYNAYNLSPYDETLLLDVDYVVNSTKLLDVFSFYEDYCIHNSASFLMYPDFTQECISPISFRTLWATVFFFKKTERVKLFFDCVKMVQENYTHYANLHGMWSYLYRNDHAFAIANRILNGHIESKCDFIPWNLIHIGEKTTVEKDKNNSFKVILDNDKKEYIIVKDLDFHMLDKKNFMRLFCE